MRVVVLLFVILGCACAPTVVDPGAAGGASSAASGSGLSGTGGGAAGGSSSKCVSPEGYAVCHGPAACPVSSSACLQCEDSGTDALSLCLNPTFDFSDPPCEDGLIVIAPVAGQMPAPFICTPFDLGVLFAANGGESRVRYLDFGDWTGTALPSPSECPTIPGVPLCGESCGACPAHQTCTGRSPLHPYSMCVPRFSFAALADQCSKEQGFFKFRVEADAQPVADLNGYCLPIAVCQAAAAGLPGGGICTAM
jgi:hypothetical protein